MPTPNLRGGKSYKKAKGGSNTTENAVAFITKDDDQMVGRIIRMLGDLNVSVFCQDNKTRVCKIAMGIHAGDHAIYPDCTENFRQADLNAFKVGNWNSERVDFYAPYMETDKAGILKDGEVCCEQLGLDFNEVYPLVDT